MLLIFQFKFLLTIKAIIYFLKKWRRPRTIATSYGKVNVKTVMNFSASMLSTSRYHVIEIILLTLYMLIQEYLQWLLSVMLSTPCHLN